MNDIGKVYVKKEMQGREWMFREETTDETFLWGKPDFDGGRNKPITLKAGALVFKKGYSPNEQTAIVTTGGTTLYHYKGSPDLAIHQQKASSAPEASENSSQCTKRKVSVSPVSLYTLISLIDKFM